MIRIDFLKCACILVFCFLLPSQCTHERTRNIYGHLITRDSTTAPRVIDKKCLLSPEHGPCRAQIKMYYFTQSDNSCRKFKWGGCQGNGNRFDTEDQCKSACISTHKISNHRPDYCQLSYDYGYCFGAFKRWHYDKDQHACLERLYSGCGGNSNSFDSKELCESVCLFRQGHVEVPWWKKSV